MMHDISELLENPSEPEQEGRSAPLLCVENLTRSFPDGHTRRTVLDSVGLEVGAGEMVAMMGPSGSGKTTLLRLAAGLDQPDSGQVLLDGVHLSGLDRRGVAELRRRFVGYVEQRWNLLDSLTVLENVALPLELCGESLRQASIEATAALDDVNLVELARAFPEDLSGGDQQRVAIARALVGTRRLVLADEPTGALDAMTAESVMRLLRRRCDSGASVLLATHDPAVAGWADRVVFLRNAILSEQGSSNGRANGVSS